MKKIDLGDLMRNGQIQEEPAIGWDQIERLMKRSFEDLKSADRNLRRLMNPAVWISSIKPCSMRQMP